MAAEAGVKGDCIELLKVLGEEIDKAAGRHLMLNVIGALPVVGRAAGLVVHIHK